MPKHCFPRDGHITKHYLVTEQDCCTAFVMFVSDTAMKHAISSIEDQDQEHSVEGMVLGLVCSEDMSLSCCLVTQLANKTDTSNHKPE